jgi:diguanylate cyclase (GGDEF)-like protein
MSHNRLEITRQLQAVIDLAAKRQDLFTVLIVRLGGVEAIREHLGYDEAEEVVQTAFSRLRSVVDPGDWVGRLSDQEFVVVSYDCNSPSCAIKGSRRSLEALREPIAVAGLECPFVPHAGIAIYPADGRLPQDLLRHALSAVRQAEAIDSDPRYAFFNHELGDRAAADFALQQELRACISKGRFALHLQPKFSLETRTLVGAEALIRWPQPDGSLRMPGQFLPLAERGRLMRPLGGWVTREACRLLADWHARGLQAVPLAINVSAEQFNAEDWLSAWEQQLEAAAVDPSSVVVEITESVAMADDASTRSRLDRLHAMGAKISVDDFGIGFSNLAMLTRFAFDEVKIDRSLVQGLDQAGATASICKAVGQIGRDLGLSILAEGVETEGQALGCERAQGYLYGRPIPVAEFERTWVKAVRTVRTARRDDLGRVAADALPVRFVTGMPMCDGPDPTAASTARV